MRIVKWCLIGFLFGVLMARADGGHWYYSVAPGAPNPDWQDNYQEVSSEAEALSAADPDNFDLLWVLDLSSGDSWWNNEATGSWFEASFRNGEWYGYVSDGNEGGIQGDDLLSYSGVRAWADAFNPSGGWILGGGGPPSSPSLAYVDMAAGMAQLKVLVIVGATLAGLVITTAIGIIAYRRWGRRSIA